MVSRVSAAERISEAQAERCRRRRVEFERERRAYWDCQDARDWP